MTQQVSLDQIREQGLTLIATFYSKKTLRAAASKYDIPLFWQQTRGIANITAYKLYK